MNGKKYLLRVESKKENVHCDLGIISCSEYPRVGDKILYGENVTYCGNGKPFPMSVEDRKYIVTGIYRKIPVVVDRQNGKSIEDTPSVIVDFLEE